MSLALRRLRGDAAAQACKAREGAGWGAYACKRVAWRCVMVHRNRRSGVGEVRAYMRCICWSVGSLEICGGPRTAATSAREQSTTPLSAGRSAPRRTRAAL